MNKHAPPKLRSFPSAKQKRLDQLLDKNSDGKITPKEQAQLVRVVAEAEKLMVANAKRFADFSLQDGGARSAEAIPVTVWIQPQGAEQ